MAFFVGVSLSQVGDHFLRLIEPAASAVPYLTCPGNHGMNARQSHNAWMSCTDDYTYGLKICGRIITQFKLFFFDGVYGKKSE